MDSDIVGCISLLFSRHGHVPYDGARREPITALEHALQCAQLAEWAQAPPSLVAAALLHDVGHFLAAESLGDHVDDAHEETALPLLRSAFDAAVTEPVRLHVQGKRFLVSTDADYAATLSPASVHSLVLQGGPMNDAEVAAFQAQPHAGDAVRLRRWDDLAKQPGRVTPALDYYLALLEELVSSPAAGAARDAGDRSAA